LEVAYEMDSPRWSRNFTRSLFREKPSRRRRQDQYILHFHQSRIFDRYLDR